jgi:uncharacterized protein with HEPN domain
MRKDDLIRVWHMLDAAEEALSFVKNKTRSDLDTERMLVLCLVKLVEMIGEAASKVTKESRDNHREIPWSSIVAMRKRLIHAYYNIDLDRVWDTITDDLPTLVTALKKIVPPEERS